MLRSRRKSRRTRRSRRRRRRRRSTSSAPPGTRTTQMEMTRTGLGTWSRRSAEGWHRGRWQPRVASPRAKVAPCATRQRRCCALRDGWGPLRDAPTAAVLCLARWLGACLRSPARLRASRARTAHSFASFEKRFALMRLGGGRRSIIVVSSRRDCPPPSSHTRTHAHAHAHATHHPHATS